MILAYAELAVLLPQCAGTQEKSPFAPPTPTPLFINMYVFWMVCVALCSHWLMLSVNCLQIRQCCGSSPRTSETRLETAQLLFIYLFSSPPLPSPFPPLCPFDSSLFRWTSSPTPPPLLLFIRPFSPPTSPPITWWLLEEKKKKVQVIAGALLPRRKQEKNGSKWK